MRAESCPAPGVLKPGLALSSPLRGKAAAAAAAARGAARALAAASYAHRIISNTQSVKRLFTLIPVPYFWIMNACF